jgi:fructose-bisphosphate aldolase class II
METAKGVPISALQKAIACGMNKINVDTDIRLAATGAIRKFFVDEPKAFDPREYNSVARAAIAAEVKKRMEAFGTVGQRDNVPNWGLAEMKKHYNS